MTLTEAKNWLKGFAAWFKWNASILNSKCPITKRVLLENFLDERMLSKLQTDVTVTMDTPITAKKWSGTKRIGLLGVPLETQMSRYPVFE